jgi:hypothetical protein
MIIWGSKCKDTIESKGLFNCPECNARKPYELIKVSKYFTLYFIPVFPMETLGKYIKCTSCNNKYNEEVLRYRPPTETDLLKSAAQQDLNSGTPVQIAVKKMINNGVAEETATKIVNEVVGNNRRKCKSCDFDFISPIQKCSGCGSLLTDSSGSTGSTGHGLSDTTPVPLTEPKLDNVVIMGNDTYADLHVRSTWILDEQVICFTDPGGNPMRTQLHPSMVDGSRLRMKGKSIEGNGDLYLNVRVEK